MWRLRLFFQMEAFGFREGNVMEQALLEQWVEELAEPDTRWPAVARLMAAGPEATDALRAGLSHRHATVRRGCCIVLDHYLDPAAVPELLANVGHKNRKVRAWALHALACDRCKEGDCRPGADDVVPLVLDRLANDPSARVRRMAVLLAAEYLGEPGVVEAIVRTAQTDPHPKVSKAAGWFVPGAPGYRRKLGTA